MKEKLSCTVNLNLLHLYKKWKRTYFPSAFAIYLFAHISLLKHPIPYTKMNCERQYKCSIPINISQLINNDRWGERNLCARGERLCWEVRAIYDLKFYVIICHTNPHPFFSTGIRIRNYSTTTRFCHFVFWHNWFFNRSPNSNNGSITNILGEDWSWFVFKKCYHSTYFTGESLHYYKE